MAAKSKREPVLTPRRVWIRRVKRLIAVGLIVTFIGLSVLVGLSFRIYSEAQAQMDTLEDKLEEVAKKPSRIVSADGVEIYQVSAEYRQPVRLSQVPKLVRDAILAAEDKRFYEHEGVDLRSLGRVAWAAFEDRRLGAGGSTLTMQLSKRLYTGSQRTLQRKAQDMALAVSIEQRKTKDQILELYLNQVYFGEGAHGIAAAANVYFGKSLEKITPAEAAILARCVRRPSYENPMRRYEKALENGRVVLGIMREEGMLTETEYKEAMAVRPKVAARRRSAAAMAPGAEHFVSHVLDVIRDDPDLDGLDLSTGGYTVRTTIDMKLQREAQTAMRKIVAENRSRNINAGAFILMDRDGKILAEVGGQDFSRSQFNYVTQARRQPGSSFKPFVYATALATKTIEFGDRVSNEKIDIPYRKGGKMESWRPRNSKAFEAPTSVSLETAFKYSVNRPAIHTLLNTGASTVVEYCHQRFGFRSRLEPVGPLALGSSEVLPIEMAEAYSVFMLRGDRVQPYPIVQIVGPDGNEVKQYQPKRLGNVLDPTVCEQIDQLMQAVVQSGTGTLARIVPNARGKTGTTNDGRDAWFCGYTDGLVGIAWFGNDKNRATREVYGGTVTVKAWAAIMKSAQARFGRPLEELPTGARPNESEPTWDEMPIPDPDTVPEETSPNELDPTIQDPASDAPRTTGTGGGGTPTEEPVTTDPLPGDGSPDGPGDPKTGSPPAEGPPPSTGGGTGGSTAGGAAEPRPERRPKPAEETEIEICGDTGLRATPYCPETVTRRVKRGSEPKRCTLHGERHG